MNVVDILGNGFLDWIKDLFVEAWKINEKIDNISKVPMATISIVGVYTCIALEAALKDCLLAEISGEKKYKESCEDIHDAKVAACECASKIHEAT